MNSIRKNIWTSFAHQINSSKVSASLNTLNVRNQLSNWGEVKSESNKTWKRPIQRKRIKITLSTRVLLTRRVCCFCVVNIAPVCVCRKSIGRRESYCFGFALRRLSFSAYRSGRYLIKTEGYHKTNRYMISLISSWIFRLWWNIAKSR